MGLNILAWVKAKKYTDNAVSQTAGLYREIVNSLPITGDEKVIYMVPITGSGDDNYNEYMWINGAYELIGNTRVDLSDYYNKTQVDTALSEKANVATSLAGYGITDAYTKSQIDTALSDKSGIVMVEKLTKDAMMTIVAGGISSMRVTATKQGYTPIGIVGAYLIKPKWQDYYPHLAIAGSYIFKSGNDYYAEVLLYNPTESDANCTGDIYVLYVKD